MAEHENSILAHLPGATNLKILATKCVIKVYDAIPIHPHDDDSDGDDVQIPDESCTISSPHHEAPSRSKPMLKFGR